MLLKIVNECVSKDVDLGRLNSITTLTETTTGFSDYRIIDNTDSENRELWLEPKDIRLSKGDIILSFK